MRKFIFTLLFLLLPLSVKAQMAVFDANTFQQMLTSVEQGKEVIDGTKEIASAAKEYVDIGKEIASNVGKAVSLGQSAKDWINGDRESLQKCLVPDIGDFTPDINIKSHDLCNSQDFLRKELGIPTSRDLERGISSSKGNLEDWGMHSWKDAVKISKNGQPVINLSNEQITTKRKKRQQYANDSRMTAAGVAHTYLNQDALKSLESIDSISDALSRTPHTTNDLLLQTNQLLLHIYKALVQQNNLIAAQTQMQAGDSLEQSGLTIQE